MNPHYDSDELNWQKIEIEYGESRYEFDTLIFWKTPEGEVFCAHDSGCSCPLPFESYEGKTADEIKAKLERVGSIAQAKATYESHGSEYDRPNTDWDAVRRQLEDWGLK